MSQTYDDLYADTRPDVQLYVAQATYKAELSTQDPAWQDPREMEVDGDIHFFAKDVRANLLDHMDIVEFEGADADFDPCDLADATRRPATGLRLRVLPKA